MKSVTYFPIHFFVKGRITYESSIYCQMLAMKNTFSQILNGKII